MKPDDFEFLSTLVRQRSGLVLTSEKSYLLESRLMPIVRRHSMKDIGDLVTAMRAKTINGLDTEITEAMTTNESFFFRDVKPFDLFRDVVLPTVVKNRAAKKSLRIWCAAASSGQEPYSLAMILQEKAAELHGWKYEIVGTDISRDILKKAESGVYSQFEVQRGLPIQLLIKYFEKDGEAWKVTPKIRSFVKYQYFNLLDNLAPLGQFDIVFCRNVLIYFDAETKRKVLEQISKLIPDDGVLFLGGAETVLGVTDKFKPLPGQRGVYGLTQARKGPEIVGQGDHIWPSI
ncbi:MAG: protein-glutamate O-methyltransferase CheR [Rhodospirillales bacterium]